MAWTALIEPPELSGYTVAVLLAALFALDVEWLRRHLGTPELYRSGVRYERERQERWRSIPAVLRDGVGDCEDLACWRAAELAVRQGIDARPLYKSQRRPDGSTGYHILVGLPGGRTEDPSRLLGMR